jgi:hypothetical protein
MDHRVPGDMQMALMRRVKRPAEQSDFDPIAMPRTGYQART